MTTLENVHFKVEIIPEQDALHISSQRFDGAELTSVLPVIRVLKGGVGLDIRVGAKDFVETTRVELDDLGPAAVAHLLSEVDGVRVKVEIALPDAHALVLVRASVTNTSAAAFAQQSYTLLNSKEVRMAAGQAGNADMGCYVNGWQSWSYSGTYGAKQKPVVTHMGPFQQPKLYDSSTPFLTRAGKYASEMFGALLDRSTRRGWLAGYLSQAEHFGHVLMTAEGQLAISAQAAGDGALIRPETTVSTDWLALECIDLDAAEPMETYLKAAALVNHVQIRSKIPVGWCSWYHYFTAIKPEIIRDNLDKLAELRDQFPVDCIQMDDGFERFVGDWLTPRPIFAAEMDLIAEDIAAENFTPGLWLAPFMVSPASDLRKKHGDWLIQKSNGKPANAGWNWEGFCFGLDLTHPQVKEYIREVIETAVKEWGYPYLKLDFLYAAALAGKRHDPTKTRARAIRDGMELIRAVAGPDVYLLGCGAPLGSMLGIVDGMRISTDVAPDWDPKYLGLELIFPNDPDLPSAKNAIQNTLTRSFMHNRWWQNDPDCLLLRPTSNLSLAEVQSLATTIFMSGGLLLISDSMNEVSGYRLKIAQAMLPLIGKAPRVLDWADRLNPRLTRHDLSGVIGDWHVLSYLNWENKAVSVDLGLEEYGLDAAGDLIVRDFWSGKTSLVTGGRLRADLAKHASALFAVRAFDPRQAAYLGGDIHLSQGMELAEWQPGEDGLRFRLALDHTTSGVVDVYLPQTPRTVKAGEAEIACTQLDDHVYRLEVSVERELMVDIRYKKSISDNSI